MFIAGFLVWLVFGVVAGFAVSSFYRAEGTIPSLTFVFALFGAWIGGMLGTAPYIFHDPSPLRFGALLGAALGAVCFSFMYHFIARKAV
jgi:uncharacterized membrane protein YeaQ/YmgE (transglycosylase-associated protein family)